MISERFKEERERLGFTQPQIGALAGSTKNTVLNWERGSSSPNAAQLEQLDRIGMDTHYVVTGKRKELSDALSSDEQVLLEAYRSLGPRERKEMFSLVMTTKKAKKKVTKVKSGNVITGDNGTQINSGNNRFTINGDYREKN